MAINFHLGSTRLAHFLDDQPERQALRSEVEMPSDCEEYSAAVWRYIELKLDLDTPLNYSFIQAEAVSAWKRGLMFWDAGDRIIEAIGPVRLA